MESGWFPVGHFQERPMEHLIGFIILMAIAVIGTINKVKEDRKAEERRRSQPKTSRDDLPAETRRQLYGDIEGDTYEVPVARPRQATPVEMPVEPGQSDAPQRRPIPLEQPQRRMDAPPRRGVPTPQQRQQMPQQRQAMPQRPQQRPAQPQRPQTMQQPAQQQWRTAQAQQEQAARRLQAQRDKHARTQYESEQAARLKRMGKEDRERHQRMQEQLRLQKELLKKHRQFLQSLRFTDQNSIKRAFVQREILGTPKALQEPFG